MKYDMILKEHKWDRCTFCSLVFLSISQIFSLEVTLICDQGWINVGAYGPMTFSRSLCIAVFFFSVLHSISDVLSL